MLLIQKYCKRYECLQSLRFLSDSFGMLLESKAALELLRIWRAVYIVVCAFFKLSAIAEDCPASNNCLSVKYFVSVPDNARSASKIESHPILLGIQVFISTKITSKYI